MIVRYLSIFIIILYTTGFSFAQSSVEELDNINQELPDEISLSEERIIQKSLNNKIYILTTQSQSFARGDFISLLIDNKLVARFLVAKILNAKAGIKLTKVYSQNLISLLGEGRKVQVLRGDDSYFLQLLANSQKPKEEDDDFKIKDEEDLFDESTFLEGDLDTKQTNPKRAISQDNLGSVFVNFFAGLDTSGNTQRYTHAHGTWGYQIHDNVWTELGFGRGQHKGFPASDIETTVDTFSVGMKYAFKTPLYTITMPYVSYNVLRVSSPCAGKTSGCDTIDSSKKNEITLLEDLGTNQIAFGVTILKRLVPGWFVRLDLGTDKLAGGLSLEF